MSNIARASTQIVQLVVLTRFLSPQEYGLMAMVTVVISYSALFSDLGLSTAFVQRQNITQEERSSLYWLSVVIGTGLMLLTMALSPLVGTLLKAPELPGLIALVATNFLVVALGQQLRADAEKALNFRPVALIEIAAALGGLLVAVLTAWLGWGVYALVSGAMFTAWASMLLAWAVLAQGWRPLLRLRWLEVRWFVRFGGGMVANNVVNHVNATVDVLLGGHLLGAAQLGLYSVPRNLILQIQSLVNPVFTRVGFPVIASIQHDKQKVQQVYLKIMNLTATINAPIYVFAAVFAPELVQMLLGEQFRGAAPLLQILALWGLFRSFGNPAGSLLFGLGRIKLATFWNVGLLFVVPPALWAGSGFGAQGMAWAMALVMALLFVPCWAVLVRPTCGASLSAYSKQVLVPASCAVIAGGFAWLCASAFQAPWVRLGAGCLTGGCAYLGFSWLWNRDCVLMGVNFITRRSAGVDQ